MRVSTAALYTLTALIAHDPTAPVIAAPPAPTATPPVSPPATAPVDKGLTASELVAPIAPAESFPIELAPTDKIAVEQTQPPALTVAAPVDIPATEKPPAASLTPAPALNAQPALSPAANAKPDAAPVFSAPSEVVSAVEKTAAPPSAPLVQTLNADVLLDQPASAQPSVSTHSSTVAVESLTLAEIKALQQGATADRPKPTAVATAPAPDGNGRANSTAPASLVSANLATQAASAFGANQAPASPTAAPPTANRPQPATSSSGQDNNHGFSLSVYNPSDNARSYYNLTSRPASQLSNGNVSLLFPLSIPAAITSAFGWRVHPVMGGARFHAGTDIGAPQGTPVLAALDGKVEIADFAGGYGLTVVLQHAKGTEQTLYGHLSEIFVQPGDTVKQGEAIGRVGSTGLSTGPHLHFELRKLTQEGWTLLDPGPSLEYALLHFQPSSQVAQVNSQLKLPTLFKSSGKFLGAVEIAAHPTQNQPVATSHPPINPPSIATRDRRITATQAQSRTQPSARRSSSPSS